MENHDTIFTVQPDDVSSIDVKFPVFDHQLEIKREEQVQVLKSSTIKCLWLLLHMITTSFLKHRLSAVQALISMLPHSCIPDRVGVCKETVKYGPFTENKSSDVCSKSSVWAVLYRALRPAYSRLPTPVVMLLFLSRVLTLDPLTSPGPSSKS